MIVGVFEAKTRLSELLELAERGEEVVITRRGHPVARLSPLTRLPHKADLQRLFADAANARRALPAISWDDLKRDRDEGRR